LRGAFTFFSGSGLALSSLPNRLSNLILSTFNASSLGLHEFSTFSTNKKRMRLLTAFPIQALNEEMPQEVITLEADVNGPETFAMMYPTSNRENWV
jgi:hypothetical protein